MKVLGVDPGLLTTGYAVIEAVQAGSKPTINLLEVGVIRTKGRGGIGPRLARIHDGFSEILDEWRPDVVAIEKLYAHYRHPATAILMGHARGIVCSLSGKRDIPIHSIASTHVKKTVTGQGHAKKHQVQRMMQHHLGLKNPPEPADVADAMAIAVSYVFNRRGRFS